MSKRKIVLLLIGLLVFGSLGIYAVIKQRSGANVNQTPINLDAVIKPRVGVFAAACSDPIECGGGVDDGITYFYENPIMTIAFYVREQLDIEEEFCIESLGNSYQPNNLPPDGHIVIGNCDIKLTSENDDENHYRAQIKISGGGNPDGDFISTYEIKKSKNKGREKINIAWKAQSERIYYLLFEEGDSSWNEDYEYKDDQIIKFSGSVDSPFEFSMDSSSDMYDDLDRWNDSELQVDVNASSWTIDTSGRVFGKVGGTWDFDNFSDSPPQKGDVKITALEFCPDDPATPGAEGCQIKLSEKLNLKAEKFGLSDGIKGDINVGATHTEDYFGNGSWDAKTNQVKWNTLTVKKEDNRDASQDLNNSKFFLSQKSKAEEDKVAGKYTARTETKKDIKWGLTPAGMIGQSNSGQQQNTNEAHADIVEDNNNGVVIRNGTGSQYLSSWIKGIYDSADVLMKITDPQNQAGKRIDPFANVPQYAVKEYFPAGTFHVPGQFTASEYEGVTAIASKKVKGVPQYVYVFRSYDTNPPDPVFPPQTLDRIDQLIGALDRAGATVYEFVTNDKRSMLWAFSRITNGSWVINAGHGAPTGLWAGKPDPNDPNDSDDKHLVTDAEINQVLKDKQIEIDTFAGLTCFAGRRTSLAQNVIGSLGVASVNELPNMFKIVGFGNQSWTLNLEDIFQEIKSQAGCSSSNIQLRKNAF